MHRLSPLLLSGVALSSLAAHAGTQTSNLANTVVVSATCTISSSGFSTTYDPVVNNASNPQSASASIVSSCTQGAAVSVTLGQGSNPATGSSDAAPLRRLAFGALYLNYGLYQDSGHTVPWGNTGPTGQTLSGSASPVTIPVYASIPGAQGSAIAGTYTDSVVVTLSF